MAFGLHQVCKKRKEAQLEMKIIFILILILLAFVILLFVKKANIAKSKRIAEIAKKKSSTDPGRIVNLWEFIQARDNEKDKKQNY